MAEDGGHGISEKELTCAICTEILYQPLTLLDCLHTFCGACLKEWFKWQATSASQSRKTASPYTCPSCRESVRRTKADWRLTTLLEGFLKANPEKSKSEQEREELAGHYKPGDNVLLPVQRRPVEDDSEDERILAEVRELSMADVDPETARRRAERTARHRRRHEQHSPEELRRRQEPNQWANQQARLTESRLREFNANEPRIEHQPSLRSLLSASDDPQDVQADILRSIYADGLLEGIDLDNLTTEQEEELTERIAEAYRRRQRQRDRSGIREGRHREQRSPRQSAPETASGSPQQSRREISAEDQQASRSRPPISRPHLFEQTLQEPSRNQRRSQSATSQRNDRSQTRNEGPAPAARSATDLSQQPSADDGQRERQSRLSNMERRITDPETGGFREQVHQYRGTNDSRASEETATRTSSSGNRSLETTRRQTLPAHQNSTHQNSTPLLIPRSPPRLNPPQTVRHVISHSAFAPEPLTDGQNAQAAPVVQCNRCNRSGIQHELHYNCRWCLNGDFNLCFHCYQDGQGCNHWFGFGFRAFDRWYRNAAPQNRPMGIDGPHILSPRRFAKVQSGDDVLYEGAFCESCFSFANDCYWYCNVCLEGAWGFCDKCVKQGKHCTHPLLVVAHINTVRGTNFDPTKRFFVGLPHLRQESYINLPVSTACDICHRPIPPNDTRYHCFQCNDGDYDVCQECYRGLQSQGKISQANGPNGWRRCLDGHRMAVINIESTNEEGHVWRIAREIVGGWNFKEEDSSSRSELPSGGLPRDGGTGMKCLALYNYFPKDGTDDLAFPKNAEIREAEDKNGDWFAGVYAGVIGVFPSNHVRTLGYP